MIKTTEIDENLLLAKFYEKDYKFSYSSISKLITAPAIFYREYVLGQKEDEVKKYLLDGIVIHYLVLENEGFDDKFLVASDNLPSEANMKVADAVFQRYKLMEDDTLELGDFPTEILETMKEINHYQGLKDTKDGTGDNKRLAKIIESKTEEYFEFLKKKQGRTIIDSATLDKCTRRAEIVKKNPQMRELLGLDLVDDGKTYGIYNELELDMEVEGLPFGFKGILDNLVIDVANKTVRINDFKTTSKSLTDFKDTVEIWNYWLQICMYEKLVKNFLKDVLKPDWALEYRFIVFDRYDQLYAFPVTEETMAGWRGRFINTLAEARYHYESKDYSLPYKFIKGDVKL